jgi:hypothetical protein
MLIEGLLAKMPASIQTLMGLQREQDREWTISLGLKSRTSRGSSSDSSISCGHPAYNCFMRV